MIVFYAWPVYLLAAAMRLQGPVPASPNPDYPLELQQADALFRSGKLLEALPLYTDLAKRNPQQWQFAERRAAGLIAKSATSSKLPEQLDLQRQAYTELLRARSLGDPNRRITGLIEKLRELFSASPGPPAAGHSGPAPLLKQGELAQAHGDYRQALTSYEAAARADTASYDAALHAGQAAGHLHEPELAGVWFSKAIAINPGREAAHREWGYALLNANQLAASRDRFIAGIVAWPYSPACWQGLQQWAEKTNARVLSPRIVRPDVPGQFDPNSIHEDGTGRSAWMRYVIGRISYRTTLFQQQFPGEPRYRHTLTEEVSCLNQTAQAARESGIPAAKLDSSLRTLLALYDAKMVEPWILLHGADDGIVADYPAYRDAHRDKIGAFIVQQDIHTSQ